MPIDSDHPLVKIAGVSFSYSEVLAVKDINLEVKRGDFLGLIGPNGSGKTTLLKIILGLLKPPSGTVSLFGKDIASFKEWSKIGYVPQKASVDIASFPISVMEIVGMGGASRKTIMESLEAVQMKEHRSALIRELSGGQQQRVFIARALASKPQLLILDEPTVGVDIESQEKFYELLKDLNQKLKLTLVLVSHDIDVVAHEVSEVACINCTLIGHGKPKEIFKSNFLEELYGKNLRFVIHGH